MNLPRIYLVVIVLLAFGVGAYGQEPPKAVLVDEYGRLPCDDMAGRIDVYYSELDKDSNSIGLVVISGTESKKHLTVLRQHMMEENAKFRDFDSKRLKYLRVNSEGDLKVQLWRIPVGADEPEVKNVDMSYALPMGIGPFMLGVEYTYGDGICPEVDDAPIYAAFLKANPSARGNIVVRERSVDRARHKATRILMQFQKQYGIPHARIRVFPRKSSYPSNNLEPIVEYWYLP